MVKGCCAPKCKTRGNLGPSVSYHKFPRDEEKLRRWIRAIPRSDWKPTRNTVICSLHFTDSDYAEESRDSNAARRNAAVAAGRGLRRRCLKPTAVPSAFPNLPGYMSKPSAKMRSSATSSSSRLQRSEERAVEDDKISCFEELKTKVKKARLPSGVKMMLQDETVLFFLLAFKDNGAPFMSRSLMVDNLLTFSLWRGERRLSFKRVSYSSPVGKISRLSEVLNLIDYLGWDLESL